MAGGVLADGYGRMHSYLRISLTSTCNFKCSYCVGDTGLKPQHTTFNFPGFLRVIRLLSLHGVSKVRLTGGEPTLRSDLPSIISTLKSIPGISHVGITTNGFLLERMGLALSTAGLDSVNISLDSLVPGKFAFITKVDAFDRVWRGVEKSLVWFPTVKINVVVMNGFNEDELGDFVGLTRNLPLTVRFIEYMPFPGNTWSQSRLLPLSVIKSMLSQHYTLTPSSLPDPIADYYTIPGHIGRVGFISSMTKPFCEKCNRIRLTADGNLKVCLHDEKEVKIDLNMRDEDILQVIKSALMSKPKEHLPISTLKDTPNRPMVSIGG